MFLLCLELWHIISTYHKKDFPNLVLLTALAHTQPIHTADCERAFSSQNLVSTALRNRLGTVTCDQLMRVKMDGPDDKTKSKFSEALLEWRKAKKKRLFFKTLQIKMKVLKDVQQSESEFSLLKAFA